MVPRTKPAEDRRADLLEAAKAVFADKGVGAATVSDVTAAAGVAKGTFYLYFQSKDQLVAALRDRFFDALLDEIAARVEELPRDDWWGRIDVLVDLGIRRQLELLDQHDVVFHHGAGIADQPAAAHAAAAELAHARAVGFLGELLAAGTRAGAFDVPDPAMTARLLFNAVHGGVCDSLHDHPHQAAGRGQPQPGREVERLVAATRLLFRRALAP